MEPFLKYPGGKTKEIPLVNKFKPSHIERYFEPFVGGGSIYLDLNVKKSFINDKSKDLFNLYRLIKKQSMKLKNILQTIDQIWLLIEKEEKIDLFDSLEMSNHEFSLLHEKALIRKNRTLAKFESNGLLISDEDKNSTKLTAKKTAFYMMVRDKYNASSSFDEYRAAYFYFLREYCYSSMFRFSKNGDFNVPYGGRSYDKKYMKSKISKMFCKETKDYFQNTEIYNLDFEDFLKKYDFKCDDFVFLDPPYDTDFSTYDNNSFDKNEQVRLANTLKQVKAPWMMIIKKTDFIKELYKDFYVVEYDMNYMVSFKNRNAKKVEHLLITDYPIDGGEQR